MGSRAWGSVVAVFRLRFPSACGNLFPWPGIKSTFPALAGGSLTTGPPGKSPHIGILKSNTVGAFTPQSLAKAMNRALPLERWLLNAGCWAWNYIVCWLHPCDKNYMWNSQFTNYPNMDEFTPILPPTPSPTLAPAFSKELKRIHRFRRGGARTLQGRLFCLLAGFPGHFLFMLTSSLKSQ